MTGIKVSFSHGTFTIQFPRDVAGPLDRPAARLSCIACGLVELIRFAAETLAARTDASMSQLDRVMFERCEMSLNRKSNNKSGGKAQEPLNKAPISPILFL